MTQKRKTVFSIRLSEELLNFLRAEAESQGFSLNALIERNLEKYFLYWRWVERLGLITLTSSTLEKILDRCPKDDIERIAKISGTTVTKNSFRTIGLNLTYDRLTNFVENNLGDFSNWFYYSQHRRGTKDIIHLRHRMGKNWSVFIANQISTMFESLLNTPSEIEIAEDFATIKIIPPRMALKKKVQ